MVGGDSEIRGISTMVGLAIAPVLCVRRAELYRRYNL